MRQKRHLVLSVLFLMLLCHTTFIPARSQQRARTVQQPSGQTSTAGVTQEPSDIVRINTRVVFVDALVKDKRTGQSVKGLTREDFQLFDDGKPRALTYFSREGDVQRRPLSLMLVFDILWGGPKALVGWRKKDLSIVERFAAALKQLPPEDEVAVMTVAYGEESDPCRPMMRGQYKIQPLEVVQALTRDRAAVAAAVLSVPRRADQLDDPTHQFSETFYPSGIDCIPDKALEMAVERPGSESAVLVITDDVGIFNPAQRSEMAEKLVRTGVPVYGLVASRNFFTDWGVSLFGMATPDNKRANVVQYLARETGGEAMRVSNPDKYVEAFERIIGGLAARYSLGFTLREDEPDDGRLHNLEVKVKARDAQGKERKLVVNARRGYYVPKASTAEPAVK